MCYSEKMFRLTILAYFLHILHCSNASMVTSIPVAVPEPVMEDMADVYERMDVYRLNDRLKGLTALKDKKYMSCFVNDYDPYWQPAPGDKQYIVQTKPCEKVDLNTDYESLRLKAGENIAKMCRELFVFWLSSQNMPPPPLFGGSSVEEIKSCPIDTEIPAILFNEGVGSNARHGSAANGNIVNGEQPPPMSGHHGDVSPNDAPPMLNGIGVPPPLHEGHAGAPPMMQGGAPPRTQDEAPPMMQGGAPPMAQGGAPPMLRGNNMPPPMEGGDMKAPPMIGAPPMIRTPPPINLLAALTQGQQSRRNAPPGPDVMLRMLSGDYATPTPDMRTPPPPPTQFRRND